MLVYLLKLAQLNPDVRGDRPKRSRSMGNCPAKPADADGASPLGARSPSDVAASKLALRVSTNVDPVMLRTRGVPRLG